MNYTKKALNNSYQTGFQLDQHQKQAWIAIVGLVLLLVLFFLIGAGRILVLVFPVGSFAVGVLLYFRYPILYVGFTWWMWFLGPLVRRIIDYQSGYITPGPLQFTSLLVTSISSITLFRHLPKSYNQGGLPFILCLGSVFYGVLSGLVQNPPKDALFLTLPLAWLCPILFSFHLFVNWRDYPKLRQTIQQTFLWGTLVMGSYGIWQFLVAPAWDQFWLVTEGVGSRGTPEPLGIRVWSTMLAPQDFATTMMAGLLLILSNSGSLLRIPAAGVGFLAFLLTQARAAWLSSLVGVFVFVSSLKPTLQIRTNIIIIVAALLLIPLVFLEPFSTVISDRIETISNIEDDTSLNARAAGYNLLLNQALSDFVGKGLGAEVSVGGTGYNLADGSILPILFGLGWVGVLPYLSGIFLLLFKLFQSTEGRFDSFASAARAITFGIFFQIGFNNMFVGPIGMLFYSFLAISMVAHKYCSHQRSSHLESG